MNDGHNGEDAPADLGCVMIREGEEAMALLSFTKATRPRLTEAERDVILGVMNGLSNAQIAERRSAAIRTIANQLAAIYRKLGVGSRAELTAKVRISDFA